MSIVLTHGYFLEEDEKEKKIMRPYPPLGLLYVSAWLERCGTPTTLIDTTFISRLTLQRKLEEEKPSLLGIYVNLMTRKNVVAIIRWVKQHTELRHTKIFLGGPEVKFNAKNFLDAGADIIVIGEGELTTQEIVARFSADLSPDLKSIQGIAFKDETGNFIFTDEREKMRDLDELPVPNRKGIDMEKYFTIWKEKHGYSMISMNTMRGCPYTCKWCSRAVYGLSYRRRSPGHVVSEMISIKKDFNPDLIWFVDDVFTISHKWLRDFVKEVKERNAIIPFECITRADRLNEEVIDLLKEAGCFRVWIGAESGSQEIINRMDRRVDVNKVREMIRITRKKEIEAGTFIMLGYPGETLSDIQETIAHLKSSAPDHFTITLTYPIRGTELFAEVENKLTKNPAWDMSSDRDLDFERSYPTLFYDYAIRWVTNSVLAEKNRDKPFKRFKLLTKAAGARLMMFVSQ